MATGRVHTVVHCQSPSGDGSYPRHVLSRRRPNLMYRNFKLTCSGKARLATTRLKVAEGLINPRQVLKMVCNQPGFFNLPGKGLFLDMSSSNIIVDNGLWNRYP